MAVITIGRMAEEILRMLNGGELSVAKNVSENEVKIAIGQLANTMLKAEHGNSLKTGETIPNGTIAALYEDIDVVQHNGLSKTTLPIKPIQLRRNLGVYSIFPKFTTEGFYEPDKEFIPIQMGQSGLLKSQPLLNDLLGQVWYEVFGNEVIFNKDLKTLFPEIKLAMRLLVMDISLYGDYDPLPILPEMEFEIKAQLVKMFSGVGVADKLVDSTTKGQQNTPLIQQKQS